jgi:hypothetical protein
MINEQAKVSDNQQPKLLSTDVQEKIDALRREVGYLVSKVKYFRPKKPVTPKPSASSGNSTTSEKKSTAGEEKTTQAPSTDDPKETTKTRSDFDQEEIDDKQFAQDIFDKYDKENKEDSSKNTNTDETDTQQEPTPSPEL